MTAPGAPRLTPGDAVLFDLDGTLAQAGAAITAAVRAALLAVGHPPLGEAALRGFIGPPLEDGFAALGMGPDVATQAVRAYREHYDLLSSPLYPGALHAVQQLRAAGLAVALATSKPQHLAQAFVDGTALAGLIDPVVGSDRAAGRITKGDVIVAALDLLGGSGRSVMIGDRRHDVEGAAEHAIACIGALWGYGSEAELSAAGAVALAVSPADLPGLLLEDAL